MMFRSPQLLWLLLCSLLFSLLGGHALLAAAAGTATADPSPADAVALTQMANAAPSSASPALSDNTDSPAGAAAEVGLRHRQLNLDASFDPYANADIENDSDAAPHPPFKAADTSDFSQVGRASWYGPRFNGNRTATGERYDMNALTAAHRTLPLASWIRVTNESNGKSVIVKINDRGPFSRNRVLDLSYAAAKVIGLVKAGIAHVKIQGLTPEQARQARDEMLASTGMSK